MLVFTAKGVDLNRAYLCPKCGDLWARILYGSPEWRPITRGCPSHKYYESEPNGSLITCREDLKEIDPEALRYEFLRALGPLTPPKVPLDPFNGFNPLDD